VGIGVTNAATTAMVGGSATLNTSTVNVMGTTSPSTFDVEATSGASGTNVGVAGALAINITNADTNARVADPMGSGTDLTLTTNSTTNSIAKAVPRLNGLGQAVGVGAAVAINVAGTNDRADVDNGASLAGINNLTQNATGQHTVMTTAAAGAQ